MVWKVEWDDDFVVGGDGARRLTPNFKLREFWFDGHIRVHRELVSSLQLLRNRFARGIGVRGVDADGLGATIAGTPTDQLLAAADALEAHSLFNLAERVGDSSVHVRIADPGDVREVGLEQALESAFEVTSGFETSGDKFQQVTGNFDGAGLSFGPAQVNFGTGTLQPMFEKFAAADRAALAACFTDADDWEEWQRVLAMPSREDQVAWANGISTGTRLADVMQPWKGYLQAVGRVPEFREVMVEHILREYGRKLLKAAGFLQSLRPDIPIDHMRCFCSLYDLVVQQGSLNKAADAIRARIADDPPADQFDLVRIAVEERGRKANKRWRADCVSRRLGILGGVPTTITESGNTTQRANINFYMLRDVVIRDARQLMNTDVSDQLAAASHALAGGSSLLA
jgi:hypothetical protein